MRQFADAAAAPSYARALNRLIGDFSAAVAFLLSGPVFEELGCTGRTFVAAAKAAYAEDGPGGDPDEARLLARQLLTQTGQLLERLAAAGKEYSELIVQQERTDRMLREDASRIIAQSLAALETGLESLNEALEDPALDDPEALASRLSAAAGESFERLRLGWQAVYAQLPNASLPQTPMAFSQRQMYIETVKLFNQHRLSGASRGGGADRGASRWLFGRGQRPSRPGVPGAYSQVLGTIVAGGGEIIRAALEQWHRGALERAMRMSAQAGDAGVGGQGDMPLPDRLAIVQRTAGQLVSLRRELVRGLSAQWFVLGLLRRSCASAQRPEAC